MCVIVTAVPGAMPEPYDILAMSETNPDGGGVSWWDGERLRVFKNVDPLKVVGFIYSHWEQLKHAPCLIHFRLATHGAVEPCNCHPFRTDRGCIAHNGIAYEYEDGPYESDSRNMVEAWIDSGYDNRAFDGQGLVALITPHGCLKWLEGDPIEYSRGVWVSNMFWNV
jgi:predicted glutamine amidotransferase